MQSLSVCDMTEEVTDGHHRRNERITIYFFAGGFYDLIKFHGSADQAKQNKKYLFSTKQLDKKYSSG